MTPWPFYEFFAGGGMARLGLGERWRCVFANEICEKKARVYRLNFGPAEELRVDDVRSIRTSDLPGPAMLAWASFPCQDLSLAGRGAGLAGRRSGTFTAFWNLMAALAREGGRVPIVVLENVPGALTSNGGSDFAAILARMSASGYRAGALAVDAVHFVPQSRPRLFIVAISRNIEIPSGLVCDGPKEPWHTKALCAAHARLPVQLRRRWVWWKLPRPVPRRSSLEDVLDHRGAVWHTTQQTQRLFALMSETNRCKVEAARAAGRPTVGAIYKRTRVENGAKAQRAEVRFDRIGGCLRTPAGGSSRQSILVVEGDSIRSRLLSAREAARLMGLPDSYRLPENYNEAYHLAGDGVVVPVVQWLEQYLLRPLATRNSGRFRGPMDYTFARDVILAQEPS